MSYQWAIEFFCRGSKMRELIRSLQQDHLSYYETINICAINFFVFSNLVVRVSWLSDSEEEAFHHIK